MADVWPQDDRAPSDAPAAHAAGSQPGVSRDSSSDDETLFIRAMSPEDIQQVGDIERASFATPWSDQTFTNLLKRPNATLVCAVDASDVVLGYAAVWFAGGEGELGDLAVDPSRRRQGIGTRLVETILQTGRLQGARQIFLEVRETNLNAQALYLKHGFDVVGRRSAYYSNPKEDALIMRCLLIR